MNLKDALARKSPDPGFADRVMARIAAGEGRTVNSVPLSARPSPGASRHPLPAGEGRLRDHRRNTWWRAAAATVLLSALGAGWAAHHARSEMILALRISAAKVRTAQQHVRDIGSH